MSIQFDARVALFLALGAATTPRRVSLSNDERASVVDLICRLLADLQAANGDSSCSTDAIRQQLTAQLRRLAVLLWRDGGPEAECVATSLRSRDAEDPPPPQV